MTAIADLIPPVADFPEPGVMFRDITPLIGSASGFAAAVQQLAEMSPRDIDVVVAMEARGFIFGAPVALALGAGFVPVRKPSKLPREVVTVTYDLEYGSETLAVHADAIRPGDRVLMVDDVLATGGTVSATSQLVSRLGGHLVQVSVLVELAYLGGRRRLADAGVEAIRTVLTLEQP